MHNRFTLGWCVWLPLCGVINLRSLVCQDVLAVELYRPETCKCVYLHRQYQWHSNVVIFSIKSRVYYITLL